MNILYCDCFAGMAGDMTVAAFIDLGVPLTVIEEGLAGLRLPPGSYRLDVSQVSRHGITATHFQVDAPHEHHHRHYADIVAILTESSLKERVRELAERIFRRLAQAEAKVHGVEMDHVHFHEVGAVDSIVDIVAVAICLDHLDIGEIHAAPLPWGSGFVQTAHGLLPVPAPATAELLTGIPVHGECGAGERVTPTGAAILAALATGFGTMPAMRIAAVGNGAGTKDFPDLPNILRLVLGNRNGHGCHDDVVVIETNIDDMNPEIFGYLMERLQEAGALDVAFTHLQMKKNRPGVKLTVLSPPGRVEKLADMILTESTAIGVRFYPAQRRTLTRTAELRQTSLGMITVKVVTDGGGLHRVVPEFEECRRLARESGRPLLDIYRLVEREVASP
jgi:uncharacterized protein (TIGR00299 family) protein